VICEHVNPKSFSIRDYKLQKVKEYIASKRFDKIKCIGDNEWDIELGLNLGAETYLFDPNNSKSETKVHHKISDLREVL